MANTFQILNFEKRFYYRKKIINFFKLTKNILFILVFQKIKNRKKLFLKKIIAIQSYYRKFKKYFYLNKLRQKKNKIQNIYKNYLIIKKTKKIKLIQSNIRG